MVFLSHTQLLIFILFIIQAIKAYNDETAHLFNIAKSIVLIIYAKYSHIFMGHLGCERKQTVYTKCKVFYQNNKLFLYSMLVS